MDSEKKQIRNLMEEAYNIGINCRLAPSVRTEAMKAYASLSLALHNMTY